MSTDETLDSEVGHVWDMLNLFAVHNGMAKIKTHAHMSFDEAMELD